MKIEPKQITVGELTNGYVDNREEGVVGFGGKLNIRPPYQREFVYDDKRRNAVIDTVMKNFPLNTMYWSRSEDGNFELLDGQQRTVSICQYVNGDFSVNHKGFVNQPADIQRKILAYPLMIYICEGEESEKLDWFRTVNIAGVKLTDQELRNAVYTGEWLTEAKRKFSKSNCVAYKMAHDYMNGSTIRQEYLETALKWITNAKNGGIEEYMARHQHDTNCNELWLYFQKVISWVKATFPNYRSKLMKGQEWGIFYNQYGEGQYDPKALEKRIAELIRDDDVTNNRGIYAYLFDGQEKNLSIRAFTDDMAEAAYERQKGICPRCKKHFDREQMEADHITPWSKGGKTNAENCQMLCAPCNRTKSDH